MANLSQHDEAYIRKRERDLIDHSAQIGRLCTLWSGLELDIAHCLIAVAYLDEPTNKNVLIGALDMRAKSSALLAIGYKRKPTDDWFERLATTINAIDNDLRLARNRMIHDYWMFMPDDDGGETINRVTLRAKVRKESGTGNRHLLLADFEPVTPDDIAALCDKIITANVTLIGLRREFELSQLSGKPASPTQIRSRDRD